MLLWEWVFAISAALLLYPYLIYPALIVPIGWVKRRLYPLPLGEPKEWPEVTIVIPAYREAQSVRPKMESIRRLDYPREKLRVLWVVATHEGDDSFDPTIQALSAYPEAEVLVVPHRGKIYSLNEARAHLHTPYALLTDADIPLSERSLRQAVCRAESDPRIALVGGIRRIRPESQSHSVAPHEALYLSYDEQIALAESAWGYALGVGGGFLLIRDAYWKRMPLGVADDLYLNLEVGFSGAKSVIEPQAQGYESPPLHIRTEFKRKVRIAYTAFQTLHHRFRWKEALRYPLFSYFLFSHKVCRYFIAPMALILLLISTSILGVKMPFSAYGIALTLQAGAWIQAFLSWNFPKLRWPWKIGLPGYFVLAHLAQLSGLWRYLRKDDPMRVWLRFERMEPQFTPS
ncbi:MAG: glycosyltransferase [Bacteroidia bacterium]|nr:glycosyltransferase [Bacteroidia bacterium]MDW8014764.1 glycosyltransferase [Bacteroidia bacterium]